VIIQIQASISKDIDTAVLNSSIKTIFGPSINAATRMFESFPGRKFEFTTDQRINENAPLRKFIFDFNGMRDENI